MHSFIHVKDFTRAFVLALQAPLSTLSGEIFSVGSHDLNYSFGEVAEKIRKQIPEVEIEYKENRDKRNYRVSFDKALLLGVCVRDQIRRRS